MHIAREIWEQWQGPFTLLLAYWLTAALVLRFVNLRWCSKRRSLNPRRYRFFLALTISVVFTPSLIGDFFVVLMPGPAIIGLLLFFRAGFYEPIYWLVGFLYYFLPIALAFAIAYVVLLRKERRCDAQTA